MAIMDCPKRRHYSSKKFRCLSLTSTCLSILVTATIVRLLVNWSNIDFRQQENIYFVNHPEPMRKFTFRGNDFPEYWSVQFGRALLQVEESVHFGLNNTESDGEWLAIEMSGKGPVRVDSEKHVILPPFFHQIHCVQTLRDGLLGKPDVTLGHLQHCANYLRQWALCRADLTLEPGDFAERDFEWDRRGALHVCRDWSQIFQEAERNWSEWVAFWYENDLERFLGRKSFQAQ